ncbi:hypothetical protein CAEBREN_31939 [Caenorhabditis brenneri]|uniref:Uncharacterized protein n=1 Tax=Caenorhabditis brenneri TaxID=135651 RepID=G0PA90_CAEBE|nr:hypothetical protein CAEBREN_31939 [Caenorhabditis brenneri]
MTTKEIYPLRSTETMKILSQDELRAGTAFINKALKILAEFDENHQKPNFDPIPLLTQMSVMLETATDEFKKNYPDPLDDRHPHRTHPDSKLGNILKVIFKNDDFMTKLVVSYVLARDNPELSIQGCRLLLACVPGLDSKVVFSEPDDFIPRLYQWAGPESTNETLQGYAMGLLAAALDNAESASKYRIDNTTMIPFALSRLRELRARAVEENGKEAQNQKPTGPTDFSELNGASNKSPSISRPKFEIPTTIAEENEQEHEIIKEKADPVSPVQPPPPKKRRTEPCLSALQRPVEAAQRVPSFHNLKNLDDSNSKWDIIQPFLIGTQQVYPLSLATYQRFILQYLTACGEYQDVSQLLLQVFEGNAMDLLMEYIDLEKTMDVRLTFDGVRYLVSLLVHRKFAIEFVERGGIEILLRLPKNSLASVGVVTVFYYIAYNNEVMEMLAALRDDIIDDAIEYILWCLEHSHESGMASACMFFSQGLYFKAFLRRFDQFDGPRKLYNYISTLNLMQFGDGELNLTEEQMHTSTQCVRSAATTLKYYLLAHIFVRVENYRKRYNNVLPCGLKFPELMQQEPLPDFKSMKHYEDVSWECETIVLEMLRYTGTVFRELNNMSVIGMIKMMLAVRVFSRDWLNISVILKNDTCVHGMDSLRIIMCQPTLHRELIQPHLYKHAEFDGLTIALQTALGRWDEESALRMAALSLVQRVTYMEPECWKLLIHRVKSKDKTAMMKPYPCELIMNNLDMMWNEVRKADGIMALIALINAKTPLTEADSIRKLATNTLAGLARHPEVRQILSKLPLIAQSGIQTLMREPVCSDKRDIHAAFCKEACHLLHVVSGRKVVYDNQGKEIQSSEKTHRQWIVENTNVTVNQVEILQLIHDHLVRSNLGAVAAMLKSEAKLPDQPASQTCSASFMDKAWPNRGNGFSKIEDGRPLLAPRVSESEIGGISARRSSHATPPSPATTRSHSADDDVFATPTLPRRYTTSGAFPKKLMISPARSKQQLFKEEVRPYMDLNTIVVNNFKHQHALCKDPVTTCPPFSLFYPHKCPERVREAKVEKNMTLRLMNQELFRPKERIVSSWSNERTIFSRFRNLKTMHDNEESYTRGVFSVDDEHIVIGHFNGEVHWINVATGADEGHTNCHGSALTYLNQSKDGSMMLTSCAYSRPLSALWRLGQAMERVYTYREDTAVRFGNTTMARIIGTCREKATVYDTETNHILGTYNAGQESLQYHKNYASFSPDDQLIFSDGLLWDVRDSKSSIHTFDRLSMKTKFGTFHPHGTQIIINSEVYDIRTFRMLHHVPELAGCKLVFNSTGNIMFASDTCDLHRPDHPDWISSLRSFDTMDYAVLTTVESRRPVMDINVSHDDQKLAMIEQIRPQFTEFLIQSATQVRMIEVGRLKDIEDENEDEEEDTREDHDDDDSDLSDDSSDEEENANGADSPQPEGSVFEALGRLEDESENDDDENPDELDDENMDFEGIINRMIRRGAQRRRRFGQAVGAGAEETEGDESGGESDGEPDREVDGDADGEADEEDEEDDNGDDSDFNEEEALEQLLDAVDEELMEAEMDEQETEDDSESGSWRTASRVGSDDINLDEMDEQEMEDEEVNEDDIPPGHDPDLDIRRATTGPNAIAAARQAYLLRGLQGYQLRNPQGAARRRHPIRPNMSHAEILEARAEEQRAQFMENIAREGDGGQQQQQQQQEGRNENEDSDAELWHSEEEEILSVSTVALNPALRRQNRRRLREDDRP